MLKILLSINDYLENIFDKIIDKLYKRRLRSIVTILLITCSINYSIIYSVSSIYYNLKCLIISSVIAVDTVRSKDEGLDVGWVEDMYGSRGIEPIIRDIVYNVRDSNKEEFNVIIDDVRDRCNKLSIIVATLVVIDLFMYVIILSILLRTISDNLNKNKEVVRDESIYQQIER